MTKLHHHALELGRPRPVTVAVLTRSRVTSERFAHRLAPFARRVLYVDHHVDHHPDGADPLVEVVVLELTRGDDAELAALCELVGEPVAVVAVVSPGRPDLAAQAVELGARSCIGPDTSGAELAAAVESAAAGARRSCATRATSRHPSRHALGRPATSRRHLR